MRRVMSDMHLPEITIAYGLTEASPGITMTPQGLVRRRSGRRPSASCCRSSKSKIVDPATGEDRARWASAASCACAATTS